MLIFWCHSEEELKRLRIALASDGAYNEVNFTYGEEAKEESGDASQPAEESTAPPVEQEQPFVAPEELGVPEGMEVPPTERMNAIVEKTALFVAQHGLQMEIVIKTKQANNQQLLFMQFDHSLNPYYKHVIQCIKSGKYKPNLQKNSKDENEEEEDEDDDDDEDGHYLHPSLLASKSTNSTQPVSNFLMGSSIEGYPYTTNSAYTMAASTPAFTANTTPYVQQRQGDDWYSLLVKQLKDKVSKNQPISHSPLGNTPTRALSPASTPVVQSGYVVSSSAPTNLVHTASDPSLPTPPGLEPVTLPTLDRIQTGGSDVKTGTNSVGSDSRGSSNYLLRESHIPMPPADVQPIVDKMAAYVAKNGKDFETVVLSKGDKRFEFLHPWHQFHPYYLFKKSVYEQQIRKEGRMDETANSDYLSAPVSFSIKSKEPEAGPLEKRNALASDESDSDEIEKIKDGSKETEKTEELKDNADEKQKSQAAVTNSEKTAAEDGSAATGTEKARKRIEALELRMAEERLKDRLAAAAREKLAASREKQLQQERKRRATLFLTMLKKDHDQKEDEATSPSPIIGPQLPGVTVGEPAVRDELANSNADDGRLNRKQQSAPSHSEKSHSSPSPGERTYHTSEKRKSRREHRSSHSSSRSPSRERRHHVRHRSRSHSKSRRHSSKSRHSSHYPSKKSKAKTPPAAYAVVRRSPSSSPRHSSYRSHSRDRTFRNQKSSYTQVRKDQRWHGSRSSKSPSHHHSWRSRSRSRSRHRHRGYSPDEARSSSHTRRSRSPDQRSNSRHGTKSPRGKRSSSPETGRHDKTASRSASPCELAKLQTAEDPEG